MNCWYSLGLQVSSEGNLIDVRWKGPADQAGMAPGQKIIGVNGNVFSPDALRDAIKQAKGSSEPIHFILQTETYLSTVDINYHDGERFPVLQRVDGTPAYLDDITKPLTKPEVVAETKDDSSK